MRRLAGKMGYLFLLAAIGAGPVAAIESQSLTIEQEFQQLRYSSMESVRQEFSLNDDGASSFGEIGKAPGHKSPGLAFLMSAAVPGLGQYYNGSLWKAVGFFGADVAAWALHITWHGDGEDLTDAFQAFNQAHWSREDYEQKYLLWVYGKTDDDSIDAGELSHHLPDEMTQQFYEMTGKYDQFAWGWDDAVFEGNTIDDYGPGNPPDTIKREGSVPFSARRDSYETMRNDANNKFDQARSMLMVALANRLISGLEAFFSAKKHNKHLAPESNSFGSVDVSASLRSFSKRRDTPWLTLTYKF